MPNSILIVISISILLVVGCATTRPDGAVCETVKADVKLYSNSAKSPSKVLQGQMFEMLKERYKPDDLRLFDFQKDQLKINYLALSAGGKWGAFGAGFLQGWSDRQTEPARPEYFDLVTGVSTGAIMATYAFLGKDYDSELDLYKRISDRDLVKPRFLSILWSNSLYKTDRLRKLVENRLEEKNILEKVKGEAKKGRGLFVGVGNLDSGRFQHVNLTKVALEEQESQRLECYVDSIMGSAAIPLVFPPVFINNEMYVDGGVREQLFVTALESALNLLIQEHDLPKNAFRKNVYLIVNGPLSVKQIRTRNSLLGVAKRTGAVVNDQLVLASLFKAYKKAEDKGWKVRHVDAGEAGAVCSKHSGENEKGLFPPEFMKCLFEEGVRLAKGADDPWREGLPDSFELWVLGETQ